VPSRLGAGPVARALRYDRPMSRLSGSARETAVLTIGEHLARSVRGVPVAPPR